MKKTIESKRHTASVFRRKDGEGRETGNYFISYFLDGKRYTESLGTDDEKRADERATIILDAIASGAKAKEIEERQKAKEEKIEKVRYDAIKILDEYFKNSDERKAITNSNERYTIEAFLKEFPNKAINEFQTSDVKEYLNKRYPKDKTSPVSFNGALGAIKRFFAFAVDENYIPNAMNPAPLRKDDTNKARFIKKRKVHDSAPKSFTNQEYIAIEKASAGHYLFPFIATARYCGLRLQELIHLEWTDWDIEKRHINIRNKPHLGFSVKNYQERQVPISSELLDKMLPYIKREGFCFPKANSERYGEQGPREAMIAIFKKAGIKKATDGGIRGAFHRFRHSFGAACAEKGIPFQTIKAWMGHHSITVTEIYATFAPKYHPDIERINIGEPETPTAQTTAKEAVLVR